MTSLFRRRLKAITVGITNAGWFGRVLASSPPSLFATLEIPFLAGEGSLLLIGL